MVLALIFWHFGGSFLSFDVLRRKPSSQQLWFTGSCVVSKVGGRGGDLSCFRCWTKNFLNYMQVWLSFFSRHFSCLSGSPYSKAFQGAAVSMDNTILEELEPYRSLDADRLKLSGSGL